MTAISLYKIIFVLEIFIDEMLFGWSLKKKPLFWLRLSGGVAANICFAFLLGLIPGGNLFSQTLMFPIIFAFSILTLLFSFDESVSTIVFIAFAAYTVQHFAFEFSSFIMSLIEWGRPPLYGMYDSVVVDLFKFDLHTFFNVWIYFFCIVATDAAAYYVFGRKISKINDFSVKADAVLIFVGAGLCIDILFNSIIVAFGDEGNVVTGLINNMYNCLCCIFLMYALFTLIDSRRVKEENATIRALWERAGEQYKLSKENIELINIKCHDLKHQIRALDGKMSVPKPVLEEIEESVGFYDSFVKTDNEALNVILTEKSIRCHKNGIALSVIADGSSVRFMNEVDVYALFGNAFDNAIEASLAIKEKSERVISLSVKQKSDMLTIIVSNRFNGEITFDKNGMPLTTKKQDGYHGFGTKSIKAIVEKYDGSLSMKTIGNVFYLTMLFPADTDGGVTGGEKNHGN